MDTTKEITRWGGQNQFEELPEDVSTDEQLEKGFWL